MNNQEAIASLKTLCHTCDLFPKCGHEKPECFQAIELAISALQAQEAKTQLSAEGTTSDLISRQANCVYCHEDSDGYVKPIEKNCHAFIRFGMDGWELSLKANGWHGSAKIMYCPMCGRSLERG